MSSYVMLFVISCCETRMYRVKLIYLDLFLGKQEGYLMPKKKDLRTILAVGSFFSLILHKTWHLP